MTESSDYSQDPICRLCEVPYANHPRCQCCGIYCGPNHFHKGVSYYRGKGLCGMCIRDWVSFERRVGQEVPWEVFLNRDKHYRADGQPLKVPRR